MQGGGIYMDRFYNKPTGPYPTICGPVIGGPYRPGSRLSFGGTSAGPPTLVSTPAPVTKCRQERPREIGFKRIFLRKESKDEGSCKVTVLGWRKWRLELLNNEIRIMSPLMGGEAVLKARKCGLSNHCDPSCEPPCKNCECGIYLRFEPPSFDEVQRDITTAGSLVRLDPKQYTIGIWFFCEALGKLQYGDIGSRSERVKPIFGVIPSYIDGDIFRRLKLYLPAFFGPQLQLLKLDEDEIRNLKWGEIIEWEE